MRSGDWPASCHIGRSAALPANHHCAVGLLPLPREEFRQLKLILHSELWRRAASRRALPCPSSFKSVSPFWISVRETSDKCCKFSFLLSVYIVFVMFLSVVRWSSVLGRKSNQLLYSRNISVNVIDPMDLFVPCEARGGCMNQNPKLTTNIACTVVQLHKNIAVGFTCTWCKFPVKYCPNITKIGWRCVDVTANDSCPYNVGYRILSYVVCLLHNELNDISHACFNVRGRCR